MAQEFIWDKSNALEKTIDVLNSGCEKFESDNDDAMYFASSDIVTSEIMDAIKEGLENIGATVSVDVKTEEFVAEIEVLVREIQDGSCWASTVPNPKFSRIVRLWVLICDLGVDEDYIVCNDDTYRIDMLREE